MRRRSVAAWWPSAAAALAAVALVLGTCVGVARGDGAPPEGEALVLSGRASVVRGQTLVVQAGTEADDGGWALEVRLAPRDPRAASRPDEPLELAGDFMLVHADDAPASGVAGGALEPDGSVSLQLADDARGFSASGRVTAGGPGMAVVSLVGRFPAVAGAARVAQAGGDQTAWRVSRVAGLTGYLLLFVNVCLGLAVRTRFVEPLLTRWRAFDLHQFTALLVLAFMGVHVVALLADRFIGFTLPQLLVPLASPYRPLETALGVVAFYLTVGIAASFYLRRRIGYRAWRAIHYLTFVAFGLSLLHGLTAGSDSASSWGSSLYWATGSAAAALTAWRFRALLDDRKSAEGERGERLERVGGRRVAEGPPRPLSTVQRPRVAAALRPGALEIHTARARERARRLMGE